MPDDEDDLMNDEEDVIPQLVPSDAESEDGPALQYEQESESDDDEARTIAKRMNAGGSEPAAKRARDVHALSIQCKVRKSELELRHAHEAAGARELQQLMASTEVKRILEELEEEADLKLPVDHRRQMPMATSQWSSDCAEI